MTAQAPQSTNDEPSGLNGGEVSLLDIAIVLAKHKKLILGIPTLAALLATALVFTMPNVYTATTKILPPQQGQSLAAGMLSQLGGLAGLAGGLTGIKNPNELYVGMLKSRTVADNLIRRFDLMNIYDTEYQSETRKRLEKLSSIAPGKDGIITIAVDDKDPARAANLANAYAEELLNLTQVLAVSEAAQRRLFFERQFTQAKENLATAEVAARKALANGGLVKVDDQGRTMVEITARLRAQIAVKEVQLSAMRTYAADQNPSMQVTLHELEGLKRELSKLEGTTANVSRDGGAGGSGIENLRLLRDLKYYETIYELLAKQFEIAKIDEAKDTAVVQILDKAIVPDKRSSPRRLLVIFLSILAGLFAAIVYVLLLGAKERLAVDPRLSGQLGALRRNLFG